MISKKDLDQVVKDLLLEKNKKNPKIITTGFGVGLNLHDSKVKDAIIRTIKNVK